MVKREKRGEKLPPLQPAARSMNLRIYAVALAFSALLFLVGLLVGAQLSSQVSQGFAKQAASLQEDTRELELMLLLISSSGNESRLCPALLEQGGIFDNRTTEFGLSLNVLEKTRGRLNPEVQSLKREYSVMQLRDYLLFRQIAGQCGRINQVIFFYTNVACQDCVEQGQILREFKREHPEVLVYTFDVDIGTPVVSALLSAYNINSYPALLVNGRVVQGKKTGTELQATLGINYNGSSSS